VAARTLNRETHAVRREAFVDAAARLVATKGYQQMSIQDILDELDASRGAFYHYFGSKSDLLEAVVERMTVAAIEALRPVADDPTLTAPQKIERLFSSLAAWKEGRSEMILALLEIWLSDENALARDKFRRGMHVHLAPLLEDILRQGVEEGTVTVSSPADASHAIVSLLQGANEAATDLYLARRAGSIGYEDVVSRLNAYAEAFDRILGVPDGSITFAKPAVLRRWYG
jgi:AcrR family transcriptional regulator